MSWNPDEVPAFGGFHATPVLPPKPQELEILEERTMFTRIEGEAGVSVDPERLISDGMRDLIFTPAMLGHPDEPQISTYGARQDRRRLEKEMALRRMPMEDAIAGKYYDQYSPVASAKAMFCQAIVQAERAEAIVKSTEDGTLIDMGVRAAKHYRAEALRIREELEKYAPGEAERARQAAETACAYLTQRRS